MRNAAPVKERCGEEIDDQIDVSGPRDFAAFGRDIQDLVKPLAAMVITPPAVISAGLNASPFSIARSKQRIWRRLRP